MLSYLVGFFLFFLPFQFALNPSASIDLPIVRVLAIIIFLWWLARALATRSLRLPPLLFTGGAFSFLFIATVSLLWASDIGFATRKILFLLNFFPLIFVFYDLGQERARTRLWLFSLILGATIASLVSLLFFVSQFVFGVESAFSWLSQDILPFFLGQNLGSAVGQFPSLLVNISGTTVLRATAFFPDPHVASFYFGITAFLAFGIFFQERRGVFLAAALILFLTDLLTFSRGGYFGLAAGGVVFLLLSWSRLEAKIKKNISIVGCILIVLFVFFGQSVVSRFTSSFSLEDTSSTDRLVLWETAVSNIAERPLLGTGTGNYILAVNPTADYRTPYYAHNLYLDIAVELGLMGLFFFLLSLSLPLFTAIRSYLQTKNFLSLSVIASISLYLTHSLFETALYSVHILPLLLFIITLALVQNKKADAVA